MELYCSRIVLFFSEVALSTTNRTFLFCFQSINEVFSFCYDYIVLHNGLLVACFSIGILQTEVAILQHLPQKVGMRIDRSCYTFFKFDVRAIKPSRNIFFVIVCITENPVLYVATNNKPKRKTSWPYDPDQHKFEKLYKELYTEKWHCKSQI